MAFADLISKGHFLLKTHYKNTLARLNPQCFPPAAMNKEIFRFL